MNARQTLFVQAYLVDPNGKKAAIAAGFSPKTAESQASRLLRNVKVRAALDKALAARAERLEVKSDDVLRELLHLARVDIGEAYDAKGRLKPLKDMSADVRRCISGLKVTTEGRGDDAQDVLEVKFWPKVQALELLGKHLGLFKADGAGINSELTIVVQSLAEAKRAKK